MGIEYRDRRRSQKRAKRRQREEERWASLAGPIETRRLDDDSRAIAEDDAGSEQRQGDVAGAHDQDELRDEPGATR